MYPIIIGIRNKSESGSTSNDNGDQDPIRLSESGQIRVFFKAFILDPNTIIIVFNHVPDTNVIGIQIGTRPAPLEIQIHL